MKNEKILLGILAICGKIMLMPGLAKVPAAVNMTISADRKITGLF